ncbi:TauD/TfdA dioxygenase family protein [Nocardioides flavescens]|uniref:Taurine catabolism dioxygenase n=1 Tax=Nocardioides flavescens TaxID=2691959 RepID=A0A6L7ELV3_9ACTN|nr:TauD/TfdA family dioxygenase [Nocardioides flavescens]MXG88307.1 taurine catabolism dioxygenase [Nocardioides flavescens]
MTIHLERPTHQRAELAVTRIGGRIGAVVEGVRVGGDLAPETVAAVRAALLEHKVLFFRDQHHVTDDDHIDFADLFGETTKAHPTVNTGSAKVLSVAANRGMAANSWHTDVTFVDRVPAMSTLRAVTIPAYGGNTVWANTAVAYEQLPPSLKALVDDLWAVHSNDYDYAMATENDAEKDDDNLQFKRDEFASTVYETQHPVVRVHPETGERTLLLGHFVKKFVGLNSSESTAIYQLLQNRVTKLENTVRWQWREGDVALWDNRATQHYAVADFGTQPREVRRVTVAGDVPRSIGGRSSVVLQGDATEFSTVASLVS